MAQLERAGGKMKSFKRVGRSGVSLATLFFVMAACGGDGDGSGGSSGLPKGDVAQDLPDDDAKELCMWLQDLINGFQPSDEQFCEASAALQSGTKDECEALIPQCLMFIGETEDEPEDFDCEMAMSSELDDCTATVGEIEDCYRDTINLQESFIEGTSCADAGKVTEPSTPSSCAVLKTKCPGLAVDDEDEEENFSCDSGGTVISSEEVCDGFEDCTDGADEAGC